MTTQQLTYLIIIIFIIVSLAFEFTGLGRGGQQIQKAKEVYAKAVETLVELASLQVKKKISAPSCINLGHCTLLLDRFCYLG